MDGEHEFTISASRHNVSNAPHLRDLEIEWRVQLPHQCGMWSITGHETSKADAVAKLETFIAEAQTTLERLRGLPENAHDLDEGYLNVMAPAAAQVPDISTAPSTEAENEASTKMRPYQ
jgi:hypothetical protein